MASPTSFDLLQAQAVTGDGVLEFNMLGVPGVWNNYVSLQDVAVQLEITGGPTQAQVSLLGKLNNSATWDTVAVFDTAQGYISGETYELYPTRYTQFKANIGVLSGGTNPTVTMHVTGRS